jgi:hypothetical protein
MSTLRELQRDIRGALLGDDDAAAARAIVGGGLAPAARLAVYRHHVLTSLTAALEATFPVVMRLVDRRFFGYAADAYVRAEPPAGPCLFEYGASFAAFLAEFPPCRDLGYLPDVARLEWAMNEALHAVDATPVAAGDLRALPPAALATRALELHPSVSLLESPWPVDAIWRANRPGADPDACVSLDTGEVRLQVWRLGDDVLLRALTPAALAFRRALVREHSLHAAAGAALETEPGVDLTGLVREILADEVLLDCGR